MFVRRIRVCHILVLVAVCRGVPGRVPVSPRGLRPDLRPPPPGSICRRRREVAAIRELIDADVWELVDSKAPRFDVVQTLLGAVGDGDPAVRAVAGGRWWLQSTVLRARRNPTSRWGGPSRPRSTRRATLMRPFGCGRRAGWRSSRSRRRKAWRSSCPPQGQQASHWADFVRPATRTTEPKPFGSWVLPTETSRRHFPLSWRR